MVQEVRAPQLLGVVLLLAELCASSGCSLLVNFDGFQGADGGSDRSAPEPGPLDSGMTGDVTNAADATGPVTAYAAAVLADMPMAYWRLGEPSGSQTCVDQTGHGHTASVVGTVTLGVPGALAHDTNTAAQFDGSGSIDAGSILDFPSPAPFSWEVWVKPTSIAGYREFLSRMTYDRNGNPIAGTYMFAWPGTGMNLGFERWVGSASVLAADTPGLTAGAWAHVVATVDASGMGVVWVNGVQVGTSGTSGGSVPATAAHMVFGAALPCALDEIAVYDHVLSAQRVAAHWAAATQ
jgi:hypothetical protein